MQTLRNARFLTRLVLVWFALFLGAAIASPIVKPQPLQWVCGGAGALKVVAGGDDDGTATAGHTLDCPLCAPGGAAVALYAVASPSADRSARVMGSAQSAALPSASIAQPPPRGPPARS